MSQEKKKRRWVRDALKYAACAGMLALAWWLWERNLGPEIREVLFPKPRPAAESREAVQAPLPNSR